MVSLEAEWRSFDGEPGQDKSRVGTVSDTAVFLSDQGLSSTVSSTSNYTLKRLAEAERKRNQTPRDTAILRTFHSLADMAGKEGLPAAVLTTARRIFDEFLTVNPQIAKKPCLLYAPAVLFLACKFENARRSMKEIAMIAGVPFQPLSEMIRGMMKDFAAAHVSLSMMASSCGSNHDADLLSTSGDESEETPSKMLRPQQTDAEDAETSTTGAKNMIGRFVASLHAMHLVSISKRMAELVFLKIPSSRLPATIAAAILYVVTQLSAEKGDRRPLDQIAQASHISVGTIRSAAKEISKRIPDVLPTEQECALFRYKVRADWKEARAKLASEKSKASSS